MTTQNEVDEILAFGYDDPTFIHDIHVLIGGEDRVKTAKTAITKLIVDARLTELCETVESMSVPGLELVPRSAGQEVLDILLKRKKDLEAQLAELEGR